MRVGIIAAMKEEAAQLKKQLMDCTQIKISTLNFYHGTIHQTDVVLVESGIGKVASAVATALLIQNMNVDVVISVGSAGAIASRLNIGDVVISNHTHYFDVDVTAFNYQPGQMAGCPAQFSADKNMIDVATKAVKHQQIPFLLGDIASSDSFIQNKQKQQEVKKQFPRSIALEMESASIAQTCWVFNIPFVVVRSISDKSDDCSSVSFDEFLPIAVQNSSRIVTEMLKILANKN